MLRRFLPLSPVLLLVILPTFAFSADEPAPKSLAFDLSYIPADACGATVWQLKRLMSAPELQMFPLEVATAATQKEVGFDLANVELAVFVIDNPFPPNPPKAGTIIHFATPVQQDKVFSRQRADMSEAQFKGKTYLKPKNAWQEAIYFPDNKTIVMAPEDLLLRMMAAQSSETSHLHQRLRALDMTAQAAAVFSLDAVRDSIKQALATVPQLPSPLADLPKLLELNSAAELRLTLKGTLRIEAVLHATEAKSAPDVERIVKSALEFGQQIAQAQLGQQLSRSQDPIEQSLAKYGQRMLKTTFDTIKVQRTGSDVSVSSEQNFGLATISIGTALLAPAVSATRDAAKRVASASNERQLLLAMLTYEAERKHLPARAIFSKDGKPLLSWRVMILPYLDDGGLYEQFHLDEPWNSENNKKLIAKMPRIFESPRDPAENGKTPYVVPVGKGTIFEGKEGMALGQIKDGMSKTLMLVEVASDKAVSWTKPEEMDYNPDKPFAGFGAAPQGGYNIGFADGHVQLLSPTVDLDVLRAIFTASGADPFDDEKLHQ